MTESGDGIAAAEKPTPLTADLGSRNEPEISLPPAGVGAVKMSPAEMTTKLGELTRFEVGSFETRYRQFVATATVEIGNTALYDQLTFLQQDLEAQLLLGKIRGVDVWANGDSGFKVVSKSWNSFVDKLYRVNFEENNRGDQPPRIRTVQEQAARSAVEDAANREWVTPDRGHTFIDDLIRTKFVLPFADGVVSASDRVTAVARGLGLQTYRRYHAKDSGYHAHHVYVLLPVPGYEEGTETEIAFEIKLLTKLQDNLGELTHLLYEYKRTGQIAPLKKRSLAWLFHSTDFNASYLGHTAQYLEAALVRLKTELADIGDDENAES